jgi:hypothetical protein
LRLVSEPGELLDLLGSCWSPHLDKIE